MRVHPCICLTLLIVFVLPTPSHGGFGATKVSLYGAGDDLDEDGLDDAIELEIGTDPLEADTDSDGWSDLAEFVNQTDPNNPDDFPIAKIIYTAGDQSGNPALRLRVEELLAEFRQRTGSARPSTGSGTISINYYYLKGNLPDLAVEVQRSDLRAGSYLLLWQHILYWNPLGSEQRYVVTIRTEDGRTLGEWVTPAPVGTTWSRAGVPFSLKPSDAGRPLTLSVIPEAGGMQYAITDFCALPAGIEVDADRNGLITQDERPEGTRPFRHWINDDDDQGEWQGSGDLPNRDDSLADFANPVVDGIRDLVDFAAVNLNLAKVVRQLRPDAGFRYYLRNRDKAVHAVLTSLTPATVGAIHSDPDLRAFGAKLDDTVTSAEVLAPDEHGRIAIPDTFLERIDERGHGILLLEGARETREPLLMEIFQGEAPVATLSLPLAIAPVESMYRHADLSGVAREYSGRPAERPKVPRPHEIEEPSGLPDAESSDRWVVMIHGYSVTAEGARGWHAETFKRLRATGSNARFVGVTWNGDTGLDYHKAVYQAFQTGDEIPKLLGFLDDSRTTLIAHSLGNIVACQAVQAGFTPNRYFMLNAALPIEALAGEADLSAQASAMTEKLWRAYPRKLYATDWSKMYQPTDPRSAYTWVNCFNRVRSTGIAINCYSPGEDVTNCPTETDSASVLATLWAGRSIDYGVWKTQELLKGVGANRSLASIAMDRSQGGWGFNLGWRGRFVPHGPSKAAGGHYELLDPATAGKLSVEQLRQYPFFRHFREIGIHRPGELKNSPMLNQRDMRYDILARGIPAQSYAAGAEPVPGITNLDLEQEGRNPMARWPADGHADRKRSHRWLHSDFKNSALPFVHPLFVAMSHTDPIR